MSEQSAEAPDSTALRVALWRALHTEVDAAPPILEDRIGLELANPDENWRSRPDMHPQGTRLFRASILARTRAIEDLLLSEFQGGTKQYLILGAGLDTFAQRQVEVASQIKIFEIDRPGPQIWKQKRLRELGYGIPDGLRFVPVNFEAAEDWSESLNQAGFDKDQKALVASAGLSMYLSRESIKEILSHVATWAPGTILAMTFLLPLELMAPEVQPGFQMAAKGAQASGTPFISFFAPQEIMDLAREAGFAQVSHLSAADLNERYFGKRNDGLRSPHNSEEILLARV